ncbi:30S ribosomal protein S8e [Candidatus Woesearchaeota archaeon]|nr:30S ribosomal protein S8e [Candidatus Woesearchaeota archaeon]
MARTQQKSRRKASGGRYHQDRTKRKYELAGYSANTKLAEERIVRTKRTLGGDHKQYILSTNQINVANAQGKTVKTEIVNVIENLANPHLVRRNIITKGAVVETKLGKARVTSRPGQEAAVNGVLI